MHMSDRSLICVGRHLSGMKARAGIFFAKYGSMVKTIDLYEIARVDSYYEKVWNLEVMPMLPNLKTCRLRMLEGFEVLVNLDRFPPGLDKPLAEDFFALCERRQHRDYTALRALSEAAVKQNKDFELITYFDFAITGGRAWVSLPSLTFNDDLLTLEALGREYDQQDIRRVLLLVRQNTRRMAREWLVAGAAYQAN